MGNNGNNNNRLMGRSRTLSQSSCTSIAEHNNETDVLILQVYTVAVTIYIYIIMLFYFISSNIFAYNVYLSSNVLS